MFEGLTGQRLMGIKRLHHRCQLEEILFIEVAGLSKIDQIEIQPSRKIKSIFDTLENPGSESGLNKKYT